VSYQGRALTKRRRLFYGKYRGKVLDVVDPLEMGRIVVDVPAVPSVATSFCMPCVPYAGPQVGFFNLPPVGANVWIEFEEGNPMRPIWSGCFWAPGELFVEFAEPTMHVWKTELMLVKLDDTPEEGGILVSCTPPAVDTELTMTFNAAGIVIDATPAVISMIVEEGITLEFPPGSIAMTEELIETEIVPTTLTCSEEGIAIEAPTMECVTEAEYSVSAGAELALTSGAAFELTAGAALEVTAGAEMALTAGAAIEITAPAEMAITSGAAMEITSPVLEITAATNVLPDLLIDGQQPLVI
jgi:Type VI secretion system/phage-baseplate injector OB domain